jgi:phospholipid transport system substrate-binding protein
MNRRALLCLLMPSLLVISFAAFGQETAMPAPERSPRAAAAAFVEMLDRRLLQVLQQPDMTPRERSVAIARILFDVTDFDVVSAHTLGRYGRLPDSAEFREFSVLFAAHVIDLGIEKLGELQVRSYAVGRADPTADGDVIVTTDVALAGRDGLTLGWRVHLAGGTPRITDIEVDGYSLTTHFNEQYRDWLSKAGLKGLIDKLRQQTRNSPSLAYIRTART